MKPILGPVSSQSTDIIDQVKGPYKRLSLRQNGGMIGLFHISVLSVFPLPHSSFSYHWSLGCYSTVGSVPRTHQSGKWWSVTAIMLKRWTHVKVLQTEINARGAFITNRQLIDAVRALRLTRVSFTQLPVSLGRRWSAALFKGCWLARAKG